MGGKAVSVISNRASCHRQISDKSLLPPRFASEADRRRLFHRGHNLDRTVELHELAANEIHLRLGTQRDGEPLFDVRRYPHDEGPPSAMRSPMVRPMACDGTNTHLDR